MNYMSDKDFDYNLPFEVDNNDSCDDDRLLMGDSDAGWEALLRVLPRSAPGSDPSLRLESRATTLEKPRKESEAKQEREKTAHF
ncbi:hypothetical protein RJT34_00484 [Clitoria ternatea]|uniref:Uncharacterized protein n=1 Tax=Clitoria ternatea TaxID=43366 RepID=A0AAN9Q2Q9_CLITE